MKNEKQNKKRAVEEEEEEENGGVTELYWVVLRFAGPCVLGSGFVLFLCEETESGYHSFFFSSMDTPPGPRATTSSRPPTTDVVWKKSYLRKSCMGL